MIEHIDDDLVEEEDTTALSTTILPLSSNRCHRRLDLLAADNEAEKTYTEPYIAKSTK